MKKTIWKYEVPAIPRDGCSVLSLPKGAQILSVQAQKNVPVLWALVDPKAELETRRFAIVGTGWDLDATGLVFLGTFQVEGGELVFHIFEKT